ncbi:unnamed protein product [Ixodes hexagonus]
MADNPKKRKLGPRVSARQFSLLLDFLTENQVLVRAATDSPLTKPERDALWDGIVKDLNAQGPAIKSRAEWKTYWNSRVCNARSRDSDVSCATRQTGGGVNNVPPLSAEDERIVSLVGTDSSRGCGGRRVPPGGNTQSSQPSAAEASVTVDPSEEEAAQEASPPQVAPPAQVAPPPQQNAVHQSPGSMPPRTVRARTGTECTARDLLSTQRDQLAAQRELLAAQQGLLATQQQQLEVQREMLHLQRGAVDALSRLASAVEGQAAASAQQSSALTTLVLHLMGVQNLQPPN